jgi:hypothetical protein
MGRFQKMIISVSKESHFHQHIDKTIYKKNISIFKINYLKIQIFINKIIYLIIYIDPLINKIIDNKYSNY